MIGVICSICKPCNLQALRQWGVLVMLVLFLERTNIGIIWLDLHRLSGDVPGLKCHKLLSEEVEA